MTITLAPIRDDRDGDAVLRARIQRPVPGSVDWVSVCPLDWIVPESGVAAMVNGIQVAVFRCVDGRLFALDNLDPFAQVHVLSRGIIGDVDGEPCVYSPMYKHAFSLATGQCLGQPEQSVTAFPVRLVNGIVFVGCWLR